MDLCIDCLHDLPWSGPACRRCARPLPATGVCGRCLTAPPPASLTLTALDYELPVPQLVGGLKYQRRLFLARVLGQLLAIRIAEAVHARLLVAPDFIVPVPLHPWRRLRRGSNQAELLARTVGYELAVPCRPRIVRRIRYTPSQTSLRRSERYKNVRGAFACEQLEGSRVAVIDDVITTGATVNELAKCLRRAGAIEVQVWAVARA